MSCYFPVHFKSCSYCLTFLLRWNNIILTSMDSLHQMLHSVLISSRWSLGTSTITSWSTSLLAKGASPWVNLFQSIPTIQIWFLDKVRILLAHMEHQEDTNSMSTHPSSPSIACTQPTLTHKNTPMVLILYDEKSARTILVSHMRGKEADKANSRASNSFATTEQSSSGIIGLPL